MKRSTYIYPPAYIFRHTAERNFIGVGTFALPSGELWLAAPWGRPPVDFEELEARKILPSLWKSADGGRTWVDSGPMPLAWNLSGMISDGGISFLDMGKGTIGLFAHRHVKGQHGGGLPVFSSTSDQGKTWTPAALVGEPEGVWYVMNDRAIRTGKGRLVLPVSHMPLGMGTYEGDRNLGLCFFSDDGGRSWRRSLVPASLEDDSRGMAEPCAAELSDGRLLMLARTGAGSLHRSFSSDAGDSWSVPEPTSLASACSSLTLKTMPDGRLIVLYNHAAPIAPGAFFPRTPLVYAISADEGRSWSDPVIIDDEGMEKKDRQCIYPSIAFSSEGMVVAYSVHAADPGGSFKNGGDDGWKIGGGKICIIPY